MDDCAAGEQDLRALTQTLIQRLTQDLDANIFLYSGSLQRPWVYQFINTVETVGADQSRPNVALILSTYGGDADAAFMLARTLRAMYNKLVLYVFGPCKSAGTLIALAASEIVMTRRAELGPLDVQLVMREDEFATLNSVLDISDALDHLIEKATGIFQEHFFGIKNAIGTITTKTAADIATNMAVGLLSPLVAQIDPLRLGEARRRMRIAEEYGARLGADRNAVKRLIEDYPSHLFVIDMEEAKGLFRDVRRPNGIELQLELCARAVSMQELSGDDVVRVPDRYPPFISYFDPDKAESQPGTAGGDDSEELSEREDGEHQEAGQNDHGRREPSVGSSEG